MRRNSGFTLVELIVVIVILGILAVTAAPKFMNLQGDAKIASLKGVQAALNSAKSLTYGKALVHGAEKKAAATVSNGSDSVDIVYGYPKAEIETLKKVLDLDLTTGTTGDYFGKVDGNAVMIYVHNGSDTGYEDTCSVKYEPATKTGDGTSAKYEPAKVTLTVTGC